MQRKQNGNGSYTTYEHDLAGQLTHLLNFNAVDQVTSRFDYTYDSLGRRVSMRTLDGAWVYTYDAVGQLTRAVFTSSNPALIPHQNLNYSYDAAGNRINTVINGTATAYVTNILNQYTSVGTATYVYDADGNLIRKTDGGATTTYDYDAENTFIGSMAPGDTWTYQYDGLGNRTATTHNGQTVRYVFDPAGLGNIVGEYNAAGVLSQHFVHAGALLSRVESGGAISFFQFDGIGNTVATTGAGGAVANSYAYLPFGGSLKTSESSANAFQYGGMFGVMKDGAGQSFMRARTYDQALGRFLETDPIGIAGGLNLYRFGDNNPVSNTDPTGLLVLPVLTEIYYLTLVTTSMGLAAEADAIFWGAGVARGVGTANGVLFNGPQVISGLRNLITLALNGVATNGATVYVLPGVTVGGASITAVAPAVTVAAPAAAAVGTAAEIAVVAPTAGAASAAAAGAVTGIGVWGYVAAGSLVLNAGIAGVVVGTIINEAVLSTETREIIGDTLVASVDAVGRLIDLLSGRDPYSRNVASRDPNDKIGPAGFGASGFIIGDRDFAYRINFENDPSATAPAQRVTITDQLSSNFDWNTFQLTEIGFGDTLLAVPPGRQNYQTTVPMTFNGQTFDVQIEVGLRSQTGEVFATFQSIDPNTELPPDVLTGFLPPEDQTGRGQGYFSYLIGPKLNLPTGTQIRNVALITFDSNPAISTDQVDPHDPSQGIDLTKQALNTIDAGIPTSSVTALPAQHVGTQITVNWSGSDDAGGSGVANYDVFVSDNNGSYLAFVTGSTATSAVYTGMVGHTYRFFSVATDNVGHREADAAGPDTITTIPPSVTLSVAPGNMAETAGTSTVTATLSAVTGFDVTVNLAFSGTATNVSDYSRSGIVIVITVGNTTGAVVLTAAHDTLGENNETIIVDISSVTNGTESGTQRVTATIVDDDAPNLSPVITGPTVTTFSQRPLITWNSVPRATEYELWMTKDPSSNVYHQATIAGSMYAPPVDFGIGKFNLWIRGKNSVGVGPWTAKYTFVINTAVTVLPIARLQPTLRPTISWNALPGAAKYDVWINDVSRGIIQHIRNMNVNGTSFTPSADLPLSVYRAWVRGIAADGTEGSWSTGVEFLTLQSPTITQGQNHTFDRTPTFAWNAVPGAAKYEVFIRNGNTGATTLHEKNITGLSFAPSIPIADGPYRWWAIGVSAQGVRSFWTAPMDIYIGGRSDLLTPLASTTDTTPTFTWRPVDGAVRYDLFVTHIGGQTQIIRQQTLTVTSYTPVIPLPLGSYRAWIRAVSSTGEVSPWSLEVVFAIVASRSIDDSDNPAGIPDVLLAVLTREEQDEDRKSNRAGSPRRIDVIQESPREELITSIDGFRPASLPAEYEAVQSEQFDDDLVVAVMDEILEGARF